MKRISLIIVIAHAAPQLPRRNEVDYLIQEGLEIAVSGVEQENAGIAPQEVEPPQQLLIQGRLAGMDEEAVALASNAIRHFQYVPEQYPFGIPCGFPPPDGITHQADSEYISIALGYAKCALDEFDKSEKIINDEEITTETLEKSIKSFENAYNMFTLAKHTIQKLLPDPNLSRHEAQIRRHQNIFTMPAPKIGDIVWLKYHYQESIKPVLLACETKVKTLAQSVDIAIIDFYFPAIENPASISFGKWQEFNKLFKSMMQHTEKTGKLQSASGVKYNINNVLSNLQPALPVFSTVFKLRNPIRNAIGDPKHEPVPAWCQHRESITPSAYETKVMKFNTFFADFVQSAMIFYKHLTYDATNKATSEIDSAIDMKSLFELGTWYAKPYASARHYLIELQRWCRLASIREDVVRTSREFLSWGHIVENKMIETTLNHFESEIKILSKEVQKFFYFKTKTTPWRDAYNELEQRSEQFLDNLKWIILVIEKGVQTWSGTLKSQQRVLKDMVQVSWKDQATIISNRCTALSTQVENTKYLLKLLKQAVESEPEQVLSSAQKYHEESKKSSPRRTSSTRQNMQDIVNQLRSSSSTIPDSPVTPAHRMPTFGK